MALDIMSMDMPKRERKRDRIHNPEMMAEDMGEGAEDMPEEDMEEMAPEEEMPAESPLAAFSDDELMEEAKSRGLV